MAARGKATEDAIADLLNARCMLNVTIKAHNEIVVDSDEWEINEALRGISTLLDRCHDALIADGVDTENAA